MVEVRNTGVSVSPHSAEVRKPVHSPAPFSTAPPDGTGPANMLPPTSMTVTPVRAMPRPAGGSGSSRHTVACPTPTPGTSAIDLVCPLGRIPMLMPRSATRVTRRSSHDDAGPGRDAGGVERGLPAPRAGRRGVARRVGAGNRGAGTGPRDPRRAYHRGRGDHPCAPASGRGAICRARPRAHRAPAHDLGGMAGRSLRDRARPTASGALRVPHRGTACRAAHALAYIHARPVGPVL